MNLGLCYLLGKGVENDEVEALRWYFVAADQDAADRNAADTSSGEAAFYIRLLKKDLSAEQCAEARRRAKKTPPQTLHFD